MLASARMRRNPEQPSVKAVSTVSSVRPTASRLRQIKTSMSVSVFGNRAENLPPTSFRFDVADPHLQMSLAVLTAADERRVQESPQSAAAAISGRGTASIWTAFTDFQSMTAHRFGIPSGNQLETPVSAHQRLPGTALERKNALAADRIPALSGNVVANPMPASIVPHPAQRKRGSRTVTWPRCVATAWLR